MLNIREYVKVQSLEEAYELNQKRTNKVIGGMLWMKMGSRNIQKAIDLSGLSCREGMFIYVECNPAFCPERLPRIWRQ